MMRVLGVEDRAIALLRARRNLTVVTIVASLAVMGVFAFTTPTDDRGESMAQVLLVAALLLPLLIGHGMISGDLRTGVAMLWLQKPVHPVAYFARRAVEVTALSVLVILALWGAGTTMVAAAAGLEDARSLLSAAPAVVLFAVCASTLLFGISAWGIQVDSMLVVATFFVSVLTLVQAEWIGDKFAWVLLPMESMMNVADFLSDGTANEGVGKSLLLVGRFLVVWVLIGTAGLFYSTRSPLPKEAAR